MKRMEKEETIDKKRLNALIRMNFREGVDGVVAMATNYAVQMTKYHYNLCSYKLNNVETARQKLIEWAKGNNYTVEYDQDKNIYTVKVPSATLTVNRHVCIIEELKGLYNNALSNSNLKDTNIEELEAYITNLPKLLGTIKTEEQYIRENFESEIAKILKRQKLCSIRQTGIDILIRQELDACGYKYKISKNSTRVVIRIDTGNYLLDFPINNSKAEKMDEVIAELRSIVETVKTLPKNVKFRNRRINIKGK